MYYIIERELIIEKQPFGAKEDEMGTLGKLEKLMCLGYLELIDDTLRFTYYSKEWAFESTCNQVNYSRFVQWFYHVILDLFKYTN